MIFAPRGLRVGRGPRRQPVAAGPPPYSLADLIDSAEQTGGVHLAELIAAIEPDMDTVIRALTAILDSAAGQGPAVAIFRAQARQFLFEDLGVYELASNPDVVSLVNRFHGLAGVPGRPEQDAGEGLRLPKRRAILAMVTALAGPRRHRRPSLTAALVGRPPASRGFRHGRGR